MLPKIAPYPEPPETSSEPFPIKSVFLAALLPALFGLSVGLFILPPRMGFDPSAGLLAWMNFVKGGTWNTIPIPDPDNIAQTIESTVTWWPPGQYLFLGLLNLAGLSFGHAALLLSFLSTLSGAIGLAALGKELGAPSKALPWIAAALGCSLYNLVNYNHFSGGEALIMALWPWVAVTAWRIRKNDKLLICTLPPLFLLGSFIKHSFAIYTLCILLFLWSERAINLKLKLSDSFLDKINNIITTSLPIGVAGAVYIIGRHNLINTESTPIQGSTHYLYSLKEILAYSPISPLTSIAGIKVPLIRLAATIFHKDYTEAWKQLASALAFFSPLTIVPYLFLIKKRRPLLRFFGITALTTVLLLSAFHILEAGISLEDRHYQQAGSLLLIAISSYAFKKKRFSLLALSFIIGTMALNITRFSRLTYSVIERHSPVYSAKDNLALLYPKPLIEDLKPIISRTDDSIIAIPHSDIALPLEPFRKPSTHFLPTYGHGFSINKKYKGRRSQITIIIQKDGFISKEEAASMFIDYGKNEWNSYQIEDYILLQTKTP